MKTQIKKYIYLVWNYWKNKYNLWVMKLALYLKKGKLIKLEFLFICIFKIIKLLLIIDMTTKISFIDKFKSSADHTTISPIFNRLIRKDLNINTSNLKK